VLPVFNHPFKLAGEIAMLDGISGGRLDVGFARAFLPHEFRRFGISPDESQARFREGLEQIELLLTQEHASHRGQFHSFENLTSLPRPTQKPRPKFYIAATQTPESFEFAGTKGYSLMAIPIGPIGGLIELYRKAWRAAGHGGDGEVMVAFHMFCHEDAGLAREIARPPFEEYFRALNEAVGDWARGTTSEGLSRLRHVGAAAALVHARRPDRVGRGLGRHPRRDQGHHPPCHVVDRQLRARLAADQFRRARFSRGAEIDAAVRARGDARVRRAHPGRPATAGAGAVAHSRPARPAHGPVDFKISRCQTARRRRLAVGYQRGIVGRDARMRCEKSGAPSAACAASLIRDRRRSSSNGSVVSTRPEW
jgi:alkanesulfonate monooxygenase SsuD/methylene tetrahydromethanopterin reductase-like flavin-dependent oxidoreductase (luciferase family)